MLDPVGKPSNMYRCMTISMYCLYVGFDHTYIDINSLAHGIKSFLVPQVWFQAVDGARTYDTDSPAWFQAGTGINVRMHAYMYVCMYVCIFVCMYVLMYDYIYVMFVCRG